MRDGLRDESIYPLWESTLRYGNRCLNRLLVKRLYEDSHLPERKSAEAAGLDLYAYIPGGTKVIDAGQKALIGTGIAVSIPRGCYGDVRMRSGTAWEKGLLLTNGAGVVDSDYRGEIMLGLKNTDPTMVVIHHGERIGQLLILPYADFPVLEVEDLDETERGTGGFGSTGTR